MKKKTTLNGTHLTQVQRKEIELVKRILGVISDSKFAYDEQQEKIDFEIVYVGLSSTDIDDVITVFSAFKNMKEATRNAISLKDLTRFMDRCYTSVKKLNHVAAFGKTYHEIITRFYIDKEFPNIDEAADALNVGSRNTFINRSREAMLQLFNIWLCTCKEEDVEILKAMLDAIDA